MDSQIVIYIQVCRFCEKLRPVLMALVYATILFFAGYGMWLMFAWWHDTAPAVHFMPGEISPTSGRPGDKLIAHLPIHKLRDCPGDVIRTIIGECGYHVVSSGPTALNKGFEGRLTYALRIPYEAIPGECGFRVQARYVCNPFDLLWHRQVHQSPIIPFKVLNYDEE